MSNLANTPKQSKKPCKSCISCTCVVCNCTFVEAQRQQGCYLYSLAVDADFAQLDRQSVPNDILKRLAHLSLFKCVVLAPADKGKGRRVLLELIMYRELTESELEQVKKSIGNEYSNIATTISPVNEMSAPNTSTAEQNCTLIVSGMTCQSCVSRVTQSIRNVAGVIDASVDLLARTATVKFRSPPCSISKIEEAITSEKYAVVNSAHTRDSTTVLMEQSEKVKSVFDITGMTCSSCVSSIESILKNVSGIDADKLVVTLLPQRVVAVHNPSVVTADDVSQAIADMGFQVNNHSSLPFHMPSAAANSIQRNTPIAETLTLRISGMTCASCVNSIETYVRKQEGIFSITISLITERAVISYLPAKIGAREILQMIGAIGYQSSLCDMTEHVSKRERNQYAFDVVCAAVFAVPTFFIGMVVMVIFGKDHIVSKFLMYELIDGVSIEDMLLLILATPVQFWLGSRFYIGAWKSFKYLKSSNVYLLSCRWILW